MENFGFDFILDKNGPRGISIKSWLDKKKLALLLIDFQNYWLNEFYGSESDIVWKDGSTKKYVFERFKNIVLPNVKKLIEACREKDIKIVYLRNASNNDKLEDMRGLLKKIVAFELKDCKGNPYHFKSEAFDSQIIDDLKPLEGDIVISKTSMGAFCSSDIENILKENRISSLLFTGGYTDACVESTVRQAFDRGYLCTIAEDACISNSEEDHLHSIKIFNKYFGWTAKTEIILKNL